MNAVMQIPKWLQQHNSDLADATLPAWLVDFRKQHWRAFLENGLPTRKDERFKYTDLHFMAAQTFANATTHSIDIDHIIKNQRVAEDAILLVFIDGYFSTTYSETNKLPMGVIAVSLMTAIKQHGELVQRYWPKQSDAKRFPFAAMNAGLFADGLFLHIPNDCEINQPVQLLSIATADNVVMSHPRSLIVLEPRAKLNIFSEQVASTTQTYLTNSVTDFYLNPGAQLEYVKLQAENQKAIHMAHLFVQQQQDSNASFTTFSLGSQFARDDLVVHLQAKGANCKTGGLYYLEQDEQYIDHHVDIDHQAPHSQSEMLYKGILDKRSKAVFNGRLLVEKDAQKILAYQANHNLLLSNSAEVNSKPELEIYADDVKCKHGATTGQLDEEALFYLRSRGIPKELARKLLLYGFAAEVIDRVSSETVRRKVEEHLRGKI